ncbi:MAG: hypothetical protein ABL949_07695 [Fimbriimonadaceae bacterium]
MRWLVTGYGPFEQITENVSGLIAPKLGVPFHILEVSYAAVDEFISSLDPDSFDAWLALGHAMGEQRIRVETLGRNTIGPRPDVRGEGNLNSVIRTGAPSMLPSSLWAPLNPFENDQIRFADDAGGYLCNYILYRGLEAFPNKLVGFLHLPPAELMAVETQVEAIRSLMNTAAAAHQR